MTNDYVAGGMRVRSWRKLALDAGYLTMRRSTPLFSLPTAAALRLDPERLMKAHIVLEQIQKHLLANQ
jgi:hypothetical protein